MAQLLFSRFAVKCLNSYFKATCFHVLENDLISQKQSRFRPGCSCTNQLLSTAYEILSVFDDGHEVRGAFFDMSKQRL